MHNSTLTRRHLVGRLAALPIAGAVGASACAPRADAGAAALMRQIDEAERQHNHARPAHEAAHAAFEAAYPTPHWTLDIANLPMRHGEDWESGFNETWPLRHIDESGAPATRYVLTTTNLRKHLEQCLFRRRRKAIRWRLRRAAKHEAAVRQAEETFRLLDVEVDLRAAERALHDLTKEVFAKPAETLSAIRVQACALDVFAKAVTEQWAQFLAGGFGTTLAANLYTTRGGPMSAAIIPFPARAAGSRQSRYQDGSIDALAKKFTDHFLPVVRASVGLLEADDFEFEGRCRGMLDTEGTKLIEEICAKMQIDGLDLTRARLRTAMARMAPEEIVRR